MSSRRSILVALLVVGLTTPLPAIAADDEPQLLAFTAKWCAPCQRDKKHFPELSKKYTVRPIDVDEYPDYAKKFKVKSVPTYILIHQGRIIRRTSNIQDLL